ncbi:MAG: hypothetical protein LBS31_12925, partial [Candidatus Adiutrix sp.]|nr:hypothetical protein [Candidatus Adiutrix sp.]
MTSKNKYGHIRRNSKSGGQAWKWAVIAAVCIWGLAVCAWGTQRLAALFGYHKALGEPIGTAFGLQWHCPWKLLEWSEMAAQFDQAQAVVDQTYLVGAGLPLLGLILYAASQQGLKGRDDLHGSAKWADYAEIGKMGYLNGEGVYVGGWYDE